MTRRTIALLTRGLACCLAGFFAAAWLPAAAQGFENFDPVPGGIAGVDVGDPTAPAPRVLFGAHDVPVLRYPRGWVALVGLARTLTPGYYAVNVIDEEAQHESRPFAVRPISRPIYPVDVSASSPLADVVARHRRALVDSPAPNDADGDDPPDLDFVLPVDLPIRFQYGLLNFSRTGYTLDFPGLGFTPGQSAAVVNPAFGQVVSIDGEDSRRRLTIHHGGGLTSVFRNLESVSVTLEDWVPKGAKLATLTGRDGVRLLPDWTVLLGGTQVDPLLLVSQRIDLRAPADTVAPAGQIE